MKTHQIIITSVLLVFILSSGIAIGSTSVTWLAGDSVSKSVTWNVKNPSDLSFTVTSFDINSLTSGQFGSAGGSYGTVGVYRNKGKVNVSIKADAQPPEETVDQRVVYAYSPTNDLEFMAVGFRADGTSYGTAWFKPGGGVSISLAGYFPAGKGGVITGYLARRKVKGGPVIPDMRASGLRAITSSSFILKLTVSQEQQ